MYKLRKFLKGIAQGMIRGLQIEAQGGGVYITSTLI